MAKATDELHWRETYFIVFPQDRRPAIEKVSSAIIKANPRYSIENPAADDNGLLQSVFIESNEDHAAVEVSYEVGEAILDQNMQWADQLKDQVTKKQLQTLLMSDARLDVAHFERMAAGGESTQAPSSFSENFGDEFGDDEFGEEEMNFDMLDPTCLLTVVEALAQLTGGLTFDPASGEIL